MNQGPAATARERDPLVIIESHLAEKVVTLMGPRQDIEWAIAETITVNGSAGTVET